MSKTVVTATTAARAKSLTRGKKPHEKDAQNHPHNDDVPAPQHAADAAHVVQDHAPVDETDAVDAASASMTSSSMAGDFSFSGDLADAASLMADSGGFDFSFSAVTQDGGAGGDAGAGDSGGDFFSDNAPYIIGGLAVVGGGIAIAASGGDDDNNGGGNPNPPANAAPTVSAQTGAGNEDAAISGKLTASDPDSDQLAFALKSGTTAPAGFTLNADGSYTLDAKDAAYQSLAEGKTQDVKVDFTVSDGKGHNVDSTLTITVTGVNDAPTIDAASTKDFSVEAGKSTTFKIAASDVDTGDTLTASLSDGPDHGTIDLATNTYTAAAGFVGDDSFTVKVADNHGASTEYTVAVHVTAPPGPVAVAIDAAGTSDASTGDFTYTVAQGAYVHTINGFGAGDQIVSPAGNPGTLVNSSFTDGQATIQYANGGQVTQIVLAGLTAAQDSALFGPSDLNTVFGAGTFA